MKYRVTYKYTNPSPAGPFRGRMVIEADEKPRKGDHVYAVFGSAVITTSSKAKGEE